VKEPTATDLAPLTAMVEGVRVGTSETEGLWLVGTVELPLMVDWGITTVDEVVQTVVRVVTVGPTVVTVVPGALETTADEDTTAEVVAAAEVETTAEEEATWLALMAKGNEYWKMDGSESRLMRMP
jgi:hypothetical protein